MAWNGSDLSSSSPANNSRAPRRLPKASTPRTPSPRRGLLAGLLVVAVGLFALWFFILRSPTPARASSASAPKSRGQIAEHQPAIITNRPAKKVEKPKPKHYWEQPTTNGLNEAQIRKWNFMHQPPAGYTNTTMATRPPPTYAIFPTYAENEIACLMSLKPGATLVGTPLYTDAFKEEFLKSCETPIIVSEEDDEYQAQLKRDMIQVKINLRERMTNGEDLGDILMETRNEIRRLAEIQQTVESDMRALIEGTAQTEADLEDCINAANKLLEEKGISPVKMNPIARRALIRSLGLTKEN